MEVDKLTTKALIGEYGPPERTSSFKAHPSTRCTFVVARDRSTAPRGIRSSPAARRATLSSARGPYGISDSIEIRDRVITNAIQGAPWLAVPAGDFTFANGVLRYAGYKQAPQWLVPGAVGVIRTVSPYLDHHVFRILSVRSEDGQVNGPILIETDMQGSTLPAVDGLANAGLVRHNAPKLTVVNCTGCIDAEELSMVPPNSPFGIFRRRTYDGSVAEAQGGYLLGRLVHLKVNVVRPTRELRHTS